MFPILEALRRRNDGEIRDSRKFARVSSRNTKYRPKEGTGGGGAHPGDLLVRPRPWPCQQAAWEAPRPPSSPPSVIPKLLFRLFFIYFFMIFLGFGKLGKSPYKIDISI